jgi:hypothetical protein
LGTNVEFSSPINRERGFEILLVLPLIVVLLGLWGLTCAGFCCKNKPSWQKVRSLQLEVLHLILTLTAFQVPLSWMTGCIFVLMPFVFLFVGFFYIFVIFFGDACQSYGGLAVQLLQDDYLSACGNGAVGNNSVCFVNKTISIMTNADHDLSLEFSPGKMITSIIANCPDGECISRRLFAWLSLSRHLTTPCSCRSDLVSLPANSCPAAPNPSC